MALKITDEQNYHDIADAIRSKLGSSDTFLPSEMAGAIESIPTGGGTSEFKTKFIDYDGAVLYEYTQDEVEALTELPPLPSHTGMVCQEWNWTLSDMKEAGRHIIVGANYTTDTGRTKIFIDVPEYDRTVFSSFMQSQIGGVKIHWGDGNTYTDDSNTNVNTSHTFSHSGSYVIEIEVLSGTIKIVGDRTSGSKLIWSNQSSEEGMVGAANYVSGIQIGDNVELGDYAFMGVNAIYVSLPCDVILSSNNIGGFYYCQLLRCLIFPRSFNTLGTYIAAYDSVLRCISIPNTVLSIESYAFDNCFLLKEVTLPDSLTTIKGSAFKACGSIDALDIPESVTGIYGYAFTECNQIGMLAIINPSIALADYCLYELEGLESISLPEGLLKIPSYFLCNDQLVLDVTIPSTVTEIGRDAFENCRSLTRIILPSGLVTIGISAFEGCKKLRELVIPAGVKKLNTMVFASCDELRSIAFLGDIESISSNSPFKYCVNIREYDFSHCTYVPTLPAGNTLVVNQNTIIKVPLALLDDFKQAQYWSIHASKIVGV